MGSTAFLFHMTTRTAITMLLPQPREQAPTISSIQDSSVDAVSSFPAYRWLTLMPCLAGSSICLWTQRRGICRTCYVKTLRMSSCFISEWWVRGKWWDFIDEQPAMSIVYIFPDVRLCSKVFGSAAVWGNLHNMNRMLGKRRDPTDSKSGY